MICRGRLKGQAAGADFSFSGLKTALRQLAETEISVEDASASFQAAVIDILRDRTRIAMADVPPRFSAKCRNKLVVAGGVAANQAIGAGLNRLCAERISPPSFHPPGSAPTMRR